jgi:hypothetical protein
MVDGTDEAFNVTLANSRNYLNKGVKRLPAYNLQNFFKRIIMPDCAEHHEIKTLRAIFYRVSGNMFGSGKYRHIRRFQGAKNYYYIDALLRYLECFLNIYSLG